MKKGLTPQVAMFLLVSLVVIIILIGIVWMKVLS